MAESEFSLPAAVFRKEGKFKPFSEDYKFLGKSKHSAVKPCYWTKKSLKNGGQCYKNRFYGIQSHQCVQMTPAQKFCNHSCVFCWRDIAQHSDSWEGGVDEPEEIVDGSIAGQLKLLTGFKGDAATSQIKYSLAQKPKHVAISLDGEPALYPRLPELIKRFHSRGMSTFLVTNGTKPEAIIRLREENALPTQLYVSLSAYDEGNYEKFIAPAGFNGWKKFLETLDMLKEIPTRTVLRLTLTKTINFDFSDRYALLIKRAQADYVEVKGYSAIGRSRKRLGLKFQPSHEEIKIFAGELQEHSGYCYSDEHVPSRIVLLSRDGTAHENRIIEFDGLVGGRDSRFS
ncbi:MAG: 4-demethylwyosine synthase TYW1 [Candidatus Micrarchaeota archaeon]